ncbi:MAG TPA: NAD(P)/FAD-dependent oxidoreductase [Gemmatimonadales bacterium]|nr:NAD(P)/FAD-dependent oxidoreductase [Gemmatimonadales bacterium]
MKHVIIIGGGFAGLNAAKALRNAPVSVTLIDRHNHHVFQPMLYQVATAALSPGDIASPIRSVLRDNRNTEVLLDEVTAIEAAERSVQLAGGRKLSYDYLIVAPGARHSYFGHDDWEKLAPGLKELEDAFAVRRRILLAFEQAEQEPDPAVQEALLTFVVVGAGPTGVEVAGALAEIKSYTLRRDFRNIDPEAARVIVMEAGPRVLPPYPTDLSLKARKTLEDLGVDVRTDTMVTDIRPDGVTIGSEFVPARTVIWAAGNVASPLLRTLGAPLDRQGRVQVNEDCTIPGHPEVFVLGDAAAFTQDGELVPGICPAAIQMGKYAAQVIASEVRLGGPGARRPFWYFDKGQLAVIGRGRAVADLGKAHFGGFIAWLLWVFVHIFFLIGFRNRVFVLLEWAISYFTYSRGARLITFDRPGHVPAGASPAIRRQVRAATAEPAGSGTER